ncbi:rhodanese-like domain-containing protein [uncultured Maribacter sp.]|uniref:rhodanese-like domain-containing protein n=1 Tax=uncultured Maribacter sp. TaxID=431308 RepID=UPI0030DD2A3D|tara:strand:- start:456 stop:803 length:348 start_codon:yes stop_codon:yes gene_type:complete
MKLRLFVLLVLLLNLACGQIDSKPITEITQEEISKVILLDVRTPQEFAQGHINGAINIDWFSDDFNAQVAEIDKDETIYVYCKKGGRSLKSQIRLKELGFLHVINLEGGYDQYVK